MSAMVDRHRYRGVIARIYESSVLAENLLEDPTYSKTENYLCRCSDTVVVFSERIEPASENDIKSESFS